MSLIDINSKKKNLSTLLGDPKHAIRVMAVPFFIAMAVIEINQFVDTFWVSGLGAKSAESISTVVPLYGLMMCAGLGISVGATTNISFRLGRGQIEEAGKLAENSLILAVIIGLLTSALVFFIARPLIDLMGAHNVIDESMLYLYPYIAFCTILLMNTILGGILRGEGAANRSTIVQISGAVLNMVIDPILIYGLDLGVLGAGLSTVMSSGIALCIGLRWYIKKDTVVPISFRSMHMDKSAMREVLGVGGPKTIQSLISNFTDYLQRIFLIIAGGTTAVMLYNYPWRYISLIRLPGGSLENAMIPVCSAAYGQDDMEKMKTGYLYTLKLALAFSIVLSAFTFIFAEPLMSIMTYEESMHELLPRFVWTMRVAVFLIPFSAMMGMGSSMLQSMKKAKIPMYYMMFWGFLKIGLYAIASTGALGVDPFEGIIYCMVAVHVFGGCCLMLLAQRTFKKICESPRPA